MRICATAILAASLSLAACAETTPVVEEEGETAEVIAVEGDTQRLTEDYLRAEFADTTNLAYSYGRADLDGADEEEYLVYVSGDGLCGTGGCRLLVLTADGDGFRKLGSMTVAQLPVGVLATTTNGYRDLGVTVGGGGLERSIAKVPFGDTAYAANPTAAPSETVGSLDIVVIGDSELTPIGDSNSQLPTE
ncbi:MAG: hypothetical protein WA908_09250 [Pontixanthobacter sp.]